MSSTSASSQTTRSISMTPSAWPYRPHWILETLLRNRCGRTWYVTWYVTSVMVLSASSTDGSSVNSTTTAGPTGIVNDLSSSVVGIAVGVAVAAVILVLICLVIAVLLIRRRRNRRRAKKIVKVENPQYQMSGDDTEPVTLGVGLTGAVKYSSGKQNGSGKRREAPLPPIYRPTVDPASDRSQWDSLTKRKAPPPPRNFNFQLYEKDSPPSSTDNLKAVDNRTATVASPVDDSKDLQTDSSHRQPLIASSPDAGETGKPSPWKDRGSTAAGPRDSETADADVEEDIRTSLIGKKASSSQSLDSYDRTKNPFFTD